MGTPSTDCRAPAPAKSNQQSSVPATPQQNSRHSALACSPVRLLAKS